MSRVYCIGILLLCWINAILGQPGHLELPTTSSISVIQLPPEGDNKYVLWDDTHGISVVLNRDETTSPLTFNFPFDVKVICSVPSISKLIEEPAL